MDIKFYNEQRNEKIEKLEELRNKIVEEKRTFTAEETEQFTNLTNEVRSIDETIKNFNLLEDTNMDMINETRAVVAETTEDIETRELREFEQFIRENRVNNMDIAANGAILPKTIANRIIAKIYEVSPLVRDCNQYRVKGTLSLPKYSESSTAITVAWTSDGSQLTSSVGTMTTIDLTGFLAGALVKVGQQLIHNTDLDLVSFVIDRMALAIARFMEDKILNGATSGGTTRFNGLSGVTQTKTTASSAAITMDELIEVQAKVPTALQSGCYWIMAPATFTALKQLKNAQNTYYLNPNPASAFGWDLLGKPIYLSDNMPAMSAGNKAVYYVNPSCVALKMPADVEMKVLNEKFADEHCVGVVGYVEFASEIEQDQGVAAVVMKT